MEKKWYVVYTTPRGEKKANHRLEEKGIETYLPLRKTIRQWSDRKKKIEVPLFTSYLFVYVDLVHGTYFPRGGRKEQQMLNGQVSSGNAQNLTNAINARNWEKVKSILQEHVAKAKERKCKIVLLSNELMVLALNSTTVWEQFDAVIVSAGFTHTRFLLILRNPVEQALSLYKHRAKGGTAADIEHWVPKHYYYGNGLLIFLKAAMVSTDDTEIAELVKDFGAEVPFMRSTKNADDFATTVDVIKEVVSEYEKIGQKFTNICCIYPTAPFVTVERLKEGYKLIDRFDSVVPVTEFSFPVWRAFRLDKESNLKYQWPEFEKSRSQDLEKLYHDAGQWYWIKNSILNNSLITSKTGSIMLSNLETQDIDNETDWRIAEMKAKILNLKR